MSYDIDTHFHEGTSTFTHVLSDSATGQCAIIDPVLDYDPASGCTDTVFIDGVLDSIAARARNLVFVLETHAHADHLSAGDYIRTKTGAKVVIGHDIQGVQEVFAGLYNEDDSFPRDGSQFDVLVREGDELSLGQTKLTVMATPGHTPACLSYLVTEGGKVQDAFVGDTLFMPDVGTARCDFPGGDAATLYDSIQRLMALGDDVTLHLCHDYPPVKRAIVSQVTVAEQRANNIHVGDAQSRDDFIEMRRQRDSGLAMPRLILPSLQVNIRAGALPEPEGNGTRYLKVPLNQF